jgi:branched-chain amino acid transport system substrate-binding protein
MLPLLPAARAAGAAEPILIGEIDSRTGILAAQGVAIAEGVRIAIDTVNAAGGVGGRPLRLLERDDEGKAETLRGGRAGRSPRRRGPRRLWTAWSGPSARSDGGSLPVPPLSTSADRRGAYFFRVSSLRPYVTATVGVVRDLVRARRVAILHATTPGATQLAAHQRQELRAAVVEVVVIEPFTPGLSDFAPLLRRVRDGQTDILVSTRFADHLLAVP